MRSSIARILLDSLDLDKESLWKDPKKLKKYVTKLRVGSSFPFMLNAHKGEVKQYSGMLSGDPPVRQMAILEVLRDVEGEFSYSYVQNKMAGGSDGSSSGLRPLPELRVLTDLGIIADKYGDGQRDSSFRKTETKRFTVNKDRLKAYFPNIDSYDSGYVPSTVSGSENNRPMKSAFGLVGGEAVENPTPLRAESRLEQYEKRSEYEMAVIILKDYLKARDEKSFWLGLNASEVNSLSVYDFRGKGMRMSVSKLRSLKGKLIDDMNSKKSQYSVTE